MQNNLMTVRQVAQRLGVREDYLRKLAREGRVPMFQIVKSGDWRIREDTFEEWVKTRQVHG
jgi:excisionase family DNA binding protein